MELIRVASGARCIAEKSDEVEPVSGYHGRVAESQ